MRDLTLSWTEVLLYRVNCQEHKERDRPDDVTKVRSTFVKQTQADVGANVRIKTHARQSLKRASNVSGHERVRLSWGHRRSIACEALCSDMNRACYIVKESAQRNCTWPARRSASRCKGSRAVEIWSQIKSPEFGLCLLLFALQESAGEVVVINIRSKSHARDEVANPIEDR